MKLLQKAKVLFLALLMTVSLVTAASAPVFAQSAKTDVCNGVALTGSGCGGGDAEVTKVVKVVIQILSLIAGIAAVVMIIVAGLKYITSGGDASSISGAKNALIYALVGLVVVALSQVIVRFVLGKV